MAVGRTYAILPWSRSSDSHQHDRGHVNRGQLSFVTRVSQKHIPSILQQYVDL